MKTITIQAKTDGKEEAAQYMLFFDLIKIATNACDIVRVQIVNENGAILFTRWKINGK